MQGSRVLTIVVVAIGLILIFSLIYINFFEMQNSYGDSLKYALSKQTGGFDYSCEEPEYPLYLVVLNNGTKTVTGFSVSVSNPLCKGAVPPLSNILLPAQKIELYLYSTQQNGTLTILGNNTLVDIDF